MTDYAPMPLQPEKNILDLYRSVIAEGLSESAGQPAADILPFLDFRNKSKNGEYSLAIPKLKLPGNPQETATRIAEAFKPGDVIEKAEAAGAFVNFYISQKHLRHELLKNYTGKLGVAYGTNDSGKGKRVLVDFSSPNIAKPFHAGHLRTSIIGNFIVNLHKTCGWDTVALNYLGDWGKQYGLLAAGFNRFGSEEELERSAVKHLFDVYVKINKLGEDDPTIHDEARAYFKRMEDGDEEVLSLWRRFREMSILEYKKTYKQLGIHFDVYSGESQVTNGMYRGLKLLEEKGLIIEENGAKLIDLTEFKLNKALVQKKDGTTLYLTRDIGAAMERYETYKFDEQYYVVAAQQDLHLAQLFKILEKAEFPWANRCHHINFGMVAGMSTRAGNVVFLDDILKQAGEKMHEVMRANEKKYAQIQDPEYVANILGVTAVMVQDYQARRIKNYAFEWKRILSFEGDTGPYLQYAHARLCSVERNALELKMIERVDPNIANLDLLVEPAAYELLKVIAEWPDVVKAGMKILEPCTITTYVFRLSKQVAVAWEHLWVMNQPAELAHARLCLYAAARVTLANGLRILGLTPLERM